jgi:hypothetical protein
LDYHGKLLCDNERRKQIVAQFDDELDLAAFMLAISGAKISTIEDKING